jgi:glycosyltransferase involved in cell wall biosynthesis
MNEAKNYKKADIDVIVLTYNHELFIDQNINSILSQKTKFSFNVLIADDCSLDKTRDIVNEWMKRDSRVFLIGTERNMGAIENARNVLNFSQSDYLALCEGDDFWIDEEKLQKQMDFLIRNPRFKMVHGDVSYFHQSTNSLGGSVNRSKGVKFPSGSIFEEYLASDKLFIFTATVLVERKLFLQCSDYDLFQAKNWMAQDLPTWLEISNQTDIGYIDTIFAAYRLADESASRSRSAEYLYRFHQSIFDVRFYYWKKYSKNENLRLRLDYLYSLSMLSDLRMTKKQHLVFELWNLKRESSFTWNLKRWLQFYFFSIIALICRK